MALMVGGEASNGGEDIDNGGGDAEGVMAPICIGCCRETGAMGGDMVGPGAMSSREML